MEGFFAWIKYWFAKVLELVASMEAWKDHFFPEDDTTTTQAQ